jgi:hypothetical protein
MESKADIRNRRKFLQSQAISWLQGATIRPVVEAARNIFIQAIKTLLVFIPRFPGTQRIDTNSKSSDTRSV